MPNAKGGTPSPASCRAPRAALHVRSIATPEKTDLPAAQQQLQESQQRLVFVDDKGEHIPVGLAACRSRHSGRAVAAWPDGTMPHCRPFIAKRQE